MSLESLAVAAALLSALLHASWNAIVKHGGGSGNRHVAMAAVFLGASLAAAPFALWFGLPDRSTWALLGVSTLIHFAYKVFLLGAYRLGDFSQVYPLARGASPLLTATGAFLLFDERLTGGQTLGVALLSAGVLSLAVPALLSGKTSRAAVGFSLATGGAIAAYTVLDGRGAQLSLEPFAYIAWIMALDGFSFVAASAVLRGPDLLRAAAAQPMALAGGVVAAAGYAMALWAMTVAPMGQIAALRETSVIFAAALGSLALKERFGPGRVFAAVLVIAGAAALKAA